MFVRMVLPALFLRRRPLNLLLLILHGRYYLGEACQRDIIPCGSKEPSNRVFRSNKRRMTGHAGAKEENWKFGKERSCEIFFYSMSKFNVKITTNMLAYLVYLPHRSHCLWCHHDPSWLDALHPCFNHCCLFSASLFCHQHGYSASLLYSSGRS